MKLKPEQVADPVVARKVGMDLLALREHSEQELCRKLITRGFESACVTATVAALTADDLLSNSRFAEAFVYSRLQRGSGPQKIQAELRERGVDDVLISNCVGAFSGQWDERVREVREKKYGVDLPIDFKERSRQMRFLQQRGFTPEQITRAFKDG